MVENCIAFFSQTGSEIVELSKAIDRKPTLIVTNREPYQLNLHPELKSLGTVMYANHNRLMEYFENPNDTVSSRNSRGFNNPNNPNEKFTSGRVSTSPRKGAFLLEEI